MDQVQRLVAEAEIRRTIADYCQSCDDGRFDDFGRCFASDAEVLLDGEVVATGRAAIQTWITAAQPAKRRGKHVTINTLIVWDGENASGATDYLFVGRTPDGPRVTTAGRYVDEFVEADGRWLFARREITFFAPPSGGR